MFPQRNLLRLAQRSAQQTRSAPVRAVQRRFNSTEGTKFPWAVDNAFNREREAVKHHAASTSGMFFFIISPMELYVLKDCHERQY